MAQENRGPKSGRKLEAGAGKQVLGKRSSQVQTSATSGEGMTGKDRSSAALSEDVQRRIGQQLRAMFDDVTDEPVPDRLLQVLAKLKSQEKK